MAKRIVFEDAKTDYKSVKYFPFDVHPGDSFVLTSDPWHYLKAWINQQRKSLLRQTPHRDRLDKALYFAELAENFQKAADLTTLPTKGTLAYYSILNLVKTYLLVNGCDLETTIEFHGLTLPSDKTTELFIGSNSGEKSVNIFSEFAKRLGCVTDPKTFISLDEMISEIPEVHEMSYNLGKLQTKKRKFLPIEIRILNNNPGRNKLTYEISFEKKNSHLMRTEKFETGLLKGLLQKQDDDPKRKDWNIYIAKSKRQYSTATYSRIYKTLCKEIEDLKIASMLTRQGYRHYLNLQPAKYKPQVYFFALMYYIGAVARYRPSLNSSILEGEYSAILNEVMITCPKQFLYYMVSKITCKICAVPMAKID